MCQSCIDIDKRVERHRELFRSTTDTAEIERINRLVANLFGDECGCIKARKSKAASVGGLVFLLPSRPSTHLHCAASSMPAVYLSRHAWRPFARTTFVLHGRYGIAVSCAGVGQKVLYGAGAGVASTIGR
jgi:hypothetical protein